MIRNGAICLALAVLLLHCAQPESENSPNSAASVAVVEDPSKISCEVTLLKVPASMNAGAQVPVRIGITNTGKEKWQAAGRFAVRLGYHWADPSKKGNWDSVVWDDGNRGDLPADVGPGGSVWITLPVKALPYRAKKARLIIAPLIDGMGWVTVNSAATVDIE